MYRFDGLHFDPVAYESPLFIGYLPYYVLKIMGLTKRIKPLPALESYSAIPASVLLLYS